jgi:hypothetical protein
MMFLHKQKPLGFRKWIELENHKKRIAEAVEGSEFPNEVISYLSTAFGNKGWDKKEWKTPVFSMIDGFQKFNPKPLPILEPPKDNKKSDWDYEERTWNYFSHLLADSYGWTLEYIAEMDVNEALGHIQEVLTSEYLNQEFHHSLSEISYSYNKNTKKSDYKPLPVPYWMRPTIKPIKKFRIKRSMLPVGYVIDASGMAEELGLGSIVTKENNETTNAPANPPTVPPPS